MPLNDRQRRCLVDLVEGELSTERVLIGVTKSDAGMRNLPIRRARVELLESVLAELHNEENPT